MKFVFFIFLLLSVTALAQDSLQITDSLPPPTADTLNPALDTARIDSLARIVDTSNLQPLPFHRFDTISFSNNPFYRIKNPVKVVSATRQWSGKEPFFYAIIFLLLFFAFIRNNFQRYMSDLFRLFFRTTFRQRQVKEQLMQSPFPSLMLNILFLLSAALFLSLLFRYYHLGDRYEFWVLFAYCLLGLLSIYLAKFLLLKFWGWLFHLSDAVNTYIFIVFTANKIIGIVLLPFIILIAFSTGTFNETALLVSLVVVCGLFLYRYFLSFLSVRKEIRMSFFHFLLYLFGLEIIPLLLINKLLLTYFA